MLEHFQIKNMFMKGCGEPNMKDISFWWNKLALLEVSCFRNWSHCAMEHVESSVCKSLDAW